MKHFENGKPFSSQYYCTCTKSILLQGKKTIKTDTNSPGSSSLGVSLIFFHTVVSVDNYRHFHVQSYGKCIS